VYRHRSGGILIAEYDRSSLFQVGVEVSVTPAKDGGYL